MNKDDAEKSLELRKKYQFLDLAESKAYTAVNHGDGKDRVYHYLRIDAGTETLKVIPVGVAPKGEEDRDSDRLSPIPVKRMKGDTMSGEGKLRHINVYKDKEPDEATEI